MENSFKVGDKVKIIKHYDSLLVGKTGVVIGFDEDGDEIAKVDDCYGLLDNTGCGHISDKKDLTFIDSRFGDTIELIK